jgi:hypothetical protein
MRKKQSSLSEEQLTLKNCGYRVGNTFANELNRNCPTQIRRKDVYFAALRWATFRCVMGGAA